MIANPRKKIIFFIGALTGGGAERVFLTLVRHIDRNNFEPHLLLLRAEGEFVCQIPDHIAVHTLSHAARGRALTSFLLLMCRFVRSVWKIRPDAVLSTGGINLALLAISRPLLPRRTKLMVRESSVLSVRLNCECRYPKLWGWMYRFLYKSIDCVVCQSDSMVQEMTGQFQLPRQKVARIYNPINRDLVCELGRSGKNPYSGVGPHLVAVGRLSIEKGFDLLIAAMPKVLEALPTARLTIVGGGPLKIALSEQAQKLGIAELVNLVEFQQNPWQYVWHADLLVVPSRREGFSNVLLEALALGKLVVAFDGPGAVGEIYGGHPAVRLVPAEDVTGLAEAIVEKYQEMSSGHSDPGVSPDWLGRFALPQIMSEYSAVFCNEPIEGARASVPASAALRPLPKP